MNKSNDIKQNENVQGFTKTLFAINSALIPFSNYQDFRREMQPEFKMMVEVNQWIVFNLALKSYLVTKLSSDMMDIPNPSDNLKADFETAINNIEDVFTSFIDGAQQISQFIQQNSSRGMKQVSSTQQVQQTPKQPLVNKIENKPESKSEKTK